MGIAAVAGPPYVLEQLLLRDDPACVLGKLSQYRVLLACQADLLPVHANPSVREVDA